MTARLRERAAIVRSVRSYFHAAGFLEVETPSIVPCPGLDVHLDAFEVPGQGWLITSPELQMKRLVAAGLREIFQICRCFRKGERGHLHEPEFTMVEWYRSGAGSQEVMADTEQLVAEACRALRDGSTRYHGGRGSIDLAPPWPTLTVEDAFGQFARVSLADVLNDEERFYRTLVDTIEPELGRDRPVFLTHWPASMASLARLHPGGIFADRFEAYVDGVELCNGFAELTDPLEQRARFEIDRRKRATMGKPVYPIDERFMAALNEGLDPCGGNALGIDRLVMLLTGERHIENVVAIPASRL